MAGLFVLVLFGTRAGGDEKGDKGVALELGKVEEAEVKSEIGEPHYGYAGQFGSFVAAKDTEALALLVVHSFPDTSRMALGRSKLTFESTKRLGNIDGWTFKTEWDGKTYPSTVFFSAQKVYFGGGVNAYIAADYREKTGWVWKLHPLRRMDLMKNGATE